MLFFPLNIPNFVHTLPCVYVFIIGIFFTDYFRVFNIPPLVMKVRVIYFISFVVYMNPHLLL